MIFTKSEGVWSYLVLEGGPLGFGMVAGGHHSYWRRHTGPRFNVSGGIIWKTRRQVTASLLVPR